MVPAMRVLPRWLALAVALVIPSLASAASYTYDAGSAVLHAWAGTGETVRIAVSGANGEYMLDATDGGSNSIAWTGPAVSGVLPYTVGNESGLTVQSAGHGASGVPLSRITVHDGSGAATVVVMGGSSPYLDPVYVDLSNAASVARIRDLTGENIDFGTTDLNITAPRILLDQGIVGAGTVTLNSQLQAIRIGSPGASITTSAGLATGALDGNGQPLVVAGPWAASGQVSDASTITATGATRTASDITATASIALNGLEVTSPGATRTITAPQISVGALTGAGTPRLVGTVTSSGGWHDLTGARVSGPLHLSGDIAAPGASIVFDDALLLSGGARTLSAAQIQTLGGVSPDVGCGAPCATPTRDLTVDGDWINRFVAHVPGSITALGRVLTPSSGIGTSTIMSDGPVDLRGGASIDVTGALTVQGAPLTLAGVREQVAAGATDSCNAGSLTIIGDWRLSAAIDCLASLLASEGRATLDADVTTTGNQVFGGPVTMGLGRGERILRAGGAAGVSVTGHPVTLAWDSVAGAGSYVATLGNGTCSTTTLSCAFADVAAVRELRARVSSLPAAASTPQPGASEGASGPRSAPARASRTLARGSRTPLTRLIRPPSSRGARTWRVTGACRIRDGRLIAPRRAARCTLTLRIARHRAQPGSRSSVVLIIR